MSELFANISGPVDEVVRSIPYLYPELALCITFLAVIITDLFLPKKFSVVVLAVTLLGLVVAGVFTCCQLDHLPGRPVFNGMIWPTRIGAGFKFIFYIAAGLFALFAFLSRQTVSHRKGTGDLFTVLIAVTLGMNLMAMASNLLMIYISIEMVSIGSYLLVGYGAATHRQSEAAIKYALFGAASSAILLYGMSLAYGFTGTLNVFDESFIRGLAALPPLSIGMTLIMILTGIGFKLSFVPMHLWSPDVYEGAPTPVTAFLSAGPKLAGFALLSLFLPAFAAGSAPTFDFYPVIAVIAIATMITGNFAAIWQDNIKRMLAYSSIGHTGFMLMAVTAGQPAYPGLLYYGLVYTLMILAAFMLADHIDEQTGTQSISGYKGFGSYFPLAMAAMVILLISLTGLPPTAGFFGKLLIFSSVWEHYQSTGSVFALLMLVTGAVTTVVSLFYYFKIPLNAYLRRREGEMSPVQPLDTKVYIAFFLVLLVVLLGIFPGIMNGYF